MTPERTVQIIQLYTPILVGILLIVGGFLLPNFALLAVGAGALGVPGVSVIQ